MYGIVKRPMKVKVQAQDRHGNPVEYEREGITARCFCHEIEHLDGHMYYERRRAACSPRTSGRDHAKGGGREGLTQPSSGRERNMKILFMGTPLFAVPSLER